MIRSATYRDFALNLHGPLTEIFFFPFSHDYSFIVSGSEDRYVYIWSTYHDLSKFTSVRRDRNDFWERIKGNLTANY